MGEITILGLGPGSFGLLTVEALDKLQQAEPLLLRTAKHPTVKELVKRGIRFESYDQVYEKKATFEEVYETIAADVLARAATAKQLVYAVPGSPLVAEKTVAIIREKAAAQGVNVSILAGMSFLEVLYSRLGIDPIDGLTIVDGCDMAAVPADTNHGLVVTQVYNNQIASEVKLSLMERYPDDFAVTVVRNLGIEGEEIKTIPLYQLDRLPVIDHLTSLYVPHLPLTGRRFTMDPLLDVMARLRSPGGCVWDLEQTHQSLRRYIVEEVYEVLEAIDRQDPEQLCEELGDLLLQIVFHARIAEEGGIFSMQDVIDGVTGKMLRRHPHVFGDITVRDAAEVVLNWEAIKKREKAGERLSVLDGVPAGLPSLMRANKLQVKAAKVGFDWDNIAPVWEKIKEELAELKDAVERGDNVEIEAEMGDVLFAVVNLGRFLQVEGETALNVTNNKFIRRFSYIEQYVQKQGLAWETLSLQELDALWNRAKVLENAKNQ
ncbi:tetrapyrrole methylase [Lucifera butyrica]|uniref:Tetrapyrrole methylase n=1 Tax=Lucifera butyrica TaxID=1351585 RepID=A0A498RB80_9FIRM|nr:nucleoside triphosphate pyrophosphohydrolase [Lucifera butyrica]VBB06378.1 tetrapyrrole methylase [Lucifera butyrica]